MCILKHQDGDIEYRVERAGFHWDGERIYFSIQTQAIDDNAFPDCYFFAVDGVMLNQGLISQEIIISTNSANLQPNVYVYTTFHAADVSANIRLELLPNEKIEISFSVESEDVNYYDSRAKRNVFLGNVILDSVLKNQLWLPA